MNKIKETFRLIKRYKIIRPNKVIQDLDDYVPENILSIYIESKINYDYRHYWAKKLGVPTNNLIAFITDISPFWKTVDDFFEKEKPRVWNYSDKHNFENAILKFLDDNHFYLFEEVRNMPPEMVTLFKLQ